MCLNPALKTNLQLLFALVVVGFQLDKWPKDVLILVRIRISKAIGRFTQMIDLLMPCDSPKHDGVNLFVDTRLVEILNSRFVVFLFKC